MYINSASNDLFLSLISVTRQGPLYIGVVTDGLSDPLNLEVGFQIKYELLTNC